MQPHLKQFQMKFNEWQNRRSGFCPSRFILPGSGGRYECLIALAAHRRCWDIVIVRGTTRTAVTNVWALFADGAQTFIIIAIFLMINMMMIIMVMVMLRQLIVIVQIEIGWRRWRGGGWRTRGWQWRWRSRCWARWGQSGRRRLWEWKGLLLCQTSHAAIDHH